MSNYFPKKKEGDCGENATKSVLSMHSIPSNISIAKKDGTSPYKITDALRKRGLKVEVKDNVSFKKLKPKSIAYYPKDDHYVAVEKKSGNKVLVNDSSEPKAKWVSKNDFEKKWKGWTIGTISEAVRKRMKNV